MVMLTEGTKLNYAKRFTQLTLFNSLKFPNGSFLVARVLLPTPHCGQGHVMLAPMLFSTWMCIPVIKAISKPHIPGNNPCHDYNRGNMVITLLLSGMHPQVSFNPNRLSCWVTKPGVKAGGHHVAASMGPFLGGTVRVAFATLGWSHTWIRVELVWSSIVHAPTVWSFCWHRVRMYPRIWTMFPLMTPWSVLRGANVFSRNSPKGLRGGIFSVQDCKTSKGRLWATTSMYFKVSRLGWVGWFDPHSRCIQVPSEKVL